MKISELTRRDIYDAIGLERINWSGRLNEPDFVARLYDLDDMESFDSRFSSMSGDIWQHRINNNDWDDDWIFTDPRINLLHCEDDLFLSFLCETIHPVVRPDVTEAEQLLQMYNQYLKNDGFQLVEKTRMSGKPVYVGKYVGTNVVPAVAAARQMAAGTDTGYLSQQITRMESAVLPDPTLAIGTSKELIETCCKTILRERNVAFEKRAEITELVKLTVKELELTPDDIPDRAKASDTMKRLLSNLASIAQGIAELRNSYGSGHGKPAGTKGLGSRHAKLAVGAASTLAVFLVETYNERKVRQEKNITNR